MPVSIQGMHGLGDNIHQRAIIRQIVTAGSDVMLSTPWPCVYFDFRQRLTLTPAKSHLRTQARNEIRERARFTRTPLPPLPRRIWYTHAGIRRHGSILGAMIAESGFDAGQFDFRFPALPHAWRESIEPIIAEARGKPIMLFRPLVERREWAGCRARNPDPDAYAALFQFLRSRFFVISIADLVPGVEWLAGKPAEVDAEYHAGEATFEHIAALAAAAALVFTPAGFATALAQAVGTPLIAVFGGHESATTISLGARLSPTLGIDPIRPCNCFRRDHACDKTIDIDRACARMEGFIDAHVAAGAAIAL